MPPNPPRPLPQWLVILGSIFVVGHLGAIVFLVLGAQSGPWPTRFGNLNSDGPYFAQKIGSYLSDNYLRHLRMTHNYHFASNRTEQEYVAFDVILKDAKGVEIKKLSIPDPDANFWVRHRQTILARNLVPDIPISGVGAEKIAAPKQKLDLIPYWESIEEKKEGLVLPNQISTMKLLIRKVPEHLLPRDRPTQKPSDWSLVAAKEYQRFLCDKHDAAKSDLIRFYRPAIMPEYLAGRRAINALPEIVSYFEEYRAR